MDAAVKAEGFPPGTLCFAGPDAPLGADGQPRTFVLDAAGAAQIQHALPPDAPAWQHAVGRLLEVWFDPSAETLTWTTSGSTGPPTRIALPRAAIRASAARTVAHFGLSPGSRVLLALPAEFTGGAMFLLRAVLHGLHVVAIAPRAVPAWPPGTRFDFVALTPHQAAAIRADSAELGTVLLGGASAAPALAGPWPAGVRVFESFGMTETLSHFALRRLIPDPEPAFTCLPGATVAARDGALVVTDTATGVTDLLTRDAATVLDAHHFIPLGRLDDVLNSGGVKVHPAAVEAALADLIPEPFVVFGRPDPSLGVAVVLRIEATADAARADRILTAARERLPRHHAPRAIEWGTIERTGSGKVKRRFSV